jgi:hypothetical protein
VNALDGDTLFTGRLAEYDDTTYVLEQCQTVADANGTIHPLKGRQYIDRIHAFLTELPT